MASLPSRLGYRHSVLALSDGMWILVDLVGGFDPCVETF